MKKEEYFCMFILFCSSQVHVSSIGIYELSESAYGLYSPIRRYRFEMHPPESLYSSQPPELNQKKKEFTKRTWPFQKNPTELNFMLTRIGR